MPSLRPPARRGLATDQGTAPPDRAARETMMQPEDVAAAIVLCARMPGRTLIEQIVMRPTRPRDVSAELGVAARLER